MQDLTFKAKYRGDKEIGSQSKQYYCVNLNKKMSTHSLAMTKSGLEGFHILPLGSMGLSHILTLDSAFKVK